MKSKRLASYLQFLLIIFVYFLLSTIAEFGFSYIFPNKFVPKKYLGCFTDSCLCNLKIERSFLNVMRDTVSIFTYKKDSLENYQILVYKLGDTTSFSLENYVHLVHGSYLAFTSAIPHLYPHQFGGFSLEYQPKEQKQSDYITVRRCGYPPNCYIAHKDRVYINGAFSNFSISKGNKYRADLALATKLSSQLSILFVKKKNDIYCFGMTPIYVDANFNKKNILKWPLCYYGIALDEIK